MLMVANIIYSNMLNAIWDKCNLAAINPSCILHEYQIFSYQRCLHLKLFIRMKSAFTRGHQTLYKTITLNMTLTNTYR